MRAFLVTLLIFGLVGLTPVQTSLAAETEAEPARVAVTIWPTPSLHVARGEDLQYEMRVENYGAGDAASISVFLPFDEDQLTLTDVRFRNGQSWVSATEDDSLTLRFDNLGADDSRTVTIYMDVARTLTDDTEIAVRASFTWTDAQDGGAGQSNEATVTIRNPRPSRTLQDAESGADTTAPTSQITAIVLQGNGYRVQWSGSDEGSGIASYDVQVCQLPCDVYGWRDWQIDTTETSAWFGPAEGKQFAFRVRARDWDGNEEAWPITAQMDTTQATGN